MGQPLSPRPAPLSPHPAHYIVHDGYTVLVTGAHGGFDGTGREGLYDFDCRILSHYALTIDGERPAHVGSELDGADRWRTHLLASLRGGTPDGPRLPQDVLELILTRQICDGMLERLVIRNHSMAPAAADLVLELGADFADVLEVGGPRRPCGTVSSSWDAAARGLRFAYRAEANGRLVERGLRVRVASAGSPPDGDGRRLRFRIGLAPAAEWIAVLVYGSLVDGVWREPTADAVQRRTALRQRWHAHRTALEPTGPVLTGAFERAANDLLALRNWEYDVSENAWVPNAGVPTYTGLFGRDSLAAAWQAAMLSRCAVRSPALPSIRPPVTRPGATRSRASCCTSGGEARSRSWISCRSEPTTANRPHRRCS